MAEYFAQNRPTINLEYVLSDLQRRHRLMAFSFVITTGHMSGGLLNESAWMGQRPDLLRNAKAAVVCEHFGAIEWKDEFGPDGKPVYRPTGRMEPMWTMAYASSRTTTFLAFG